MGCSMVLVVPRGALPSCSRGTRKIPAAFTMSAAPDAGRPTRNRPGGMKTKTDKAIEETTQKATAGRGVSTDRIYTKREFMRCLGIGEEAWRSLKASGLKTCQAGARVMVRGAELDRLLREREK
jgi:hypothetical protein